MKILFWLWVGGALGQAAYTSFDDGAVRSVRHSYHRKGWPFLIGRLLALALWPVLTVVFLLFARTAIRLVNEKEGVKVMPVRCEVCGFEDEFCIVRGKWLQDTPYWYGRILDSGITVCSRACAKHWETHHEGKKT